MTPTIAHIGLGAFHRAHQLCYMQKLRLLDDQVVKAEKGHAVPFVGKLAWRCVSVSLRSSNVIKQLRAQQLRFHVLEISGGNHRVLPVEVLTNVLHPELDGLACVIDALSAPEVAVITLTVTEKGYAIDAELAYIRSQLNELKFTDLQVLGEQLNAMQQPLCQCVMGVLVAVLLRRFCTHGKGVSLLSCDNLQQNGKVLEKAIRALCQPCPPDFQQWLTDQCRFPSSMVDRIVPAMNRRAFDVLERSLGRPDPCGIVCEPFQQWVIEDNFIHGRPMWDQVGVQLVDEVAPYERMKLGLLNAAHSWMAYLGLVHQITHVADFFAEPLMAKALRQLMLDELAPVLTPIEGLDYAAYAEALIERFKNSFLQHELSQIATDGSQKLPQRWFPVLFRQARQGLSAPSPLLVLGFAAWLHCLWQSSLSTAIAEFADPQKESLQALCPITMHGREEDRLAIAEAFKHVLSILDYAMRRRQYLGEENQSVDELNESTAEYVDYDYALIQQVSTMFLQLAKTNIPSVLATLIVDN